MILTDPWASSVISEATSPRLLPRCAHYCPSGHMGPGGLKELNPHVGHSGPPFPSFVSPSVAHTPVEPGGYRQGACGPYLAPIPVSFNVHGILRKCTFGCLSTGILFQSVMVPTPLYA